jgi:hypothetical protein
LYPSGTSRGILSERGRVANSPWSSACIRPFYSMVLPLRIILFINPEQLEAEMPIVWVASDRDAFPVAPVPKDCGCLVFSCNYSTHSFNLLSNNFETRRAFIYFWISLYSRKCMNSSCHLTHQPNLQPNGECSMCVNRSSATCCTRFASVVPNVTESSLEPSSTSDWTSI